jgi:hypothetical protein
MWESMGVVGLDLSYLQLPGLILLVDWNRVDILADRCNV